MRSKSFAAPPVALVDGIDATVALVADREGASAGAAQQQSLEQRKTFSGRAAEHRALTIGAVMRQALLILVEFLGTDVSLVVFAQVNAPVRHSHRAHILAHLTLWRDGLGVLVTTEDVGTSVRRVPDDGQNAPVAESTPNELAGPRASIGAFGEAQAILRKALDDGVGAAGLLEQAKYQLNGPAHFGIGVHDNATLIVITKANRQGETQLALLCLVQLTPEEAPAQKMQLGLGHRTLQTEQQPVVEVPRVVAAIGVDDQGVRQGA